ncbi:MAG: ral secretory system protein domain protein [Chthoniobacteraceae bacterium]|nr:ral secretory system protein domain protein [Chthoniobacteraceae bacterium]
MGTQIRNRANDGTIPAKRNFFSMHQIPPIASPEDQDQIVQTIEMFEVIVEANPRDCQSMEILKEAYQRIGLRAETLRMSRKLAETYVDLGQLSSALLEYEGILQLDHGNPEIILALGEVEERMHQSGLVPQFSNPSSTPINLDFQAAVMESSGLMATTSTVTPSTARFATSGSRGEDLIASLTDDGNDPLARFLVQHRLVSEDIVSSALQMVQKKNMERPPSVVALSLLGELFRREAGDPETILCSILDRSKFAYIPLEYYDVDRQIVKMLPESLTLGRLMVPFDLISRTIMIATVNPFDSRGREAVQHMLDFNIQWHLASPTALLKVLSETYRISAAAGKDGGMRLAS